MLSAVMLSVVHVECRVLGVTMLTVVVAFFMPFSDF
jgi:hypothetical protein